MASANELKWVELVSSGIELKEATRLVFKDVSESSRASKTSQLKYKFIDEVNALLNKEMKQLAPTAFRIIMQLAQTAEQESVKAKCAMDILDRTGYKPSLQIEDVTEKAQSEEEILQSISEELKSMKEQGIDLITLSKEIEH